MKIHVFNIPACDSELLTKELNQLLSSHRIADVRKEFVESGIHSFWSICVTTVSPEIPSPSINKSRIDYRDVLPEADFAVFARLRTLRKELAESDGVPPYAIFTNEQLAEMVKQRITSLTALRGISGVGAARVEKYGNRFIEQINLPSSATAGFEPSNTAAIPI